MRALLKRMAEILSPSGEIYKSSAEIKAIALAAQAELDKQPNAWELRDGELFKNGEAMGRVEEFETLFQTCSQRWSRYGWDFQKLLTCIRECDFE